MNSLSGKHLDEEIGDFFENAVEQLYLILNGCHPNYGRDLPLDVLRRASKYDGERSLPLEFYDAISQSSGKEEIYGVIEAVRERGNKLLDSFDLDDHRVDLCEKMDRQTKIAIFFQETCEKVEKIKPGAMGDNYHPSGPNVEFYMAVTHAVD